MEEEYILSGQPIELLVKQLSQPSVTLEDIQSLCTTNHQARELCNTNPLLRRLIEGKRTAVLIDRDEEEEFKILIYSYIGRMRLVNYITIKPDENSEVQVNVDKMLNEIKEDNFAYFGGDHIFHLDESGQRITQAKDYMMETGLFPPGYDFHHAKFLNMPFDLLKSILNEIQQMTDNGERGKLKILVNGDVQYA